MTSARHLGKTTALFAVALALGVQSATFAAPVATHRALSNPALQANAAHTLTVLHNFTGGNDGGNPQGNLDLEVSYSNHSLIRTFYGTTEGGGVNFAGTTFSYLLGSNVFTSLYSFTGGTDGNTPLEGLANNDFDYFASGSTQFGVTIGGGAGGQGVVYAVGANGIPVVVHAFTGGADGGSPAGRLTRFIDGNYYGTTSSGGANGGTIYRVTPSGVFSTIYTFTGGNDGASPAAGLSLNYNFGGNARPKSLSAMGAVKNSSQYVLPYLYGTTSGAGAFSSGTLFRIPANGVFQVLYTFKGTTDGGSPAARLTTDYAGNLYGTTTVGGSAGNGVVFALPYNATATKTLYDFGTGATGATPLAQLEFAFNGNLYGTTSQGGAFNQGSVFELSRSGFADIHDFNFTDGSSPQGGLTDGGDGNLYGTATSGGAGGQGVLFSISE